MPNPIIFLRFRRFSTFLAFRSEVIFWGDDAFFRTLRLALVWAKPYYQNARIDRGIIFSFRINLGNYCKLPGRSGFLGVSLISVFSLYLINLSGTLCGRPPPGPTAAAAVALTVRAASPPRAPRRRRSAGARRVRAPPPAPARLQAHSAMPKSHITLH